MWFFFIYIYLSWIKCLLFPTVAVLTLIEHNLNIALLHITDYKVTVKIYHICVTGNTFSEIKQHRILNWKDKYVLDRSTFIDSILCQAEWRFIAAYAFDVSSQPWKTSKRMINTECKYTSINVMKTLVASVSLSDFNNFCE